jgi:hypothetical protein
MMVVVMMTILVMMTTLVMMTMKVTMTKVMMTMKDSGSDKIMLLVMKNQECVSLVMIVLYVVYWMITKKKLKIVQIVLMLILKTSILINAIQLMKDSGSKKMMLNHLLLVIQTIQVNALLVILLLANVVLI